MAQRPNDQYNPYVERYERAALAAESREQGEALISSMAQGMTMDYMVEFGRESAAVTYAHQILDERFGPKVPARARRSTT